MRGACSDAIRARIMSFTAAISSANAAARRSCGFVATVSRLMTFIRLRIDKDANDAYVGYMKELLRTNDPTVIAFATALLDGEGIACFQFDVNMSILEGSIGIMPRRLMVIDRDLFIAEAVMRDNEIDLGR
jgi:hypothetical protein